MLHGPSSGLAPVTVYRAGDGGNGGRTGEGWHDALGTDAPGGGGGDGHPHDDRGGRTGGDGDGDGGRGKRERWWPGRKPLIILCAVVFLLVTAGLAWWLATRDQEGAGYASTVGNVLAVYRTDPTRGPALDDVVKAEQGALELARDRHRKGLSPFPDVPDAGRQWSEGRQQAVQGALQTTTDPGAPYKALGGGWQATGSAMGRATVGTTSPQQADTARAR
ncbi:hypothetical protein DIE06_07940 [Burkholderia sp. Bp8998]|nr:hypothetical protein DIE06_07940 [Burkholderia sp. Bp8998]